MRRPSKVLVVMAIAGFVGAVWALLALSQQPGEEGWRGEGSGSAGDCEVFKTWQCYIDYRGANPDIVVGTWLEPGDCYGSWGGTREYIDHNPILDASGVWFNSDSTFGGTWEGVWEDLRGTATPDTAYDEWEATWGRTGSGDWWSWLREYP